MFEIPFRIPMAGHLYFFAWYPVAHTGLLHCLEITMKILFYRGDYTAEKLVVQEIATYMT